MWNVAGFITSEMKIKIMVFDIGSLTLFATASVGGQEGNDEGENMIKLTNFKKKQETKYFRNRNGIFSAFKNVDFVQPFF